MTSSPRGLNHDATVSELIDHDLRTWKAQLVQQCLTPLQALEVLSIPLSHADLEDKLIWGRTQSGEFTVRTATTVARELEDRQQHLNRAGCFGEFDGRWTRLWSAEANPRAKNLCWRACHDAIPTCVNLFKWGVDCRH